MVFQLYQWLIIYLFIYFITLCLSSDKIDYNFVTYYSR